MTKEYKYKYIYKKKAYASVKTEKEWLPYGPGEKEIYHFVPWENRFDWEEKGIKPEEVREYGNNIEKIKV